MNYTYGTTPRMERLTVKNYRSLQDVSIEDMTTLTVLLGPNGSGKSAVFDILSFLAECFESGLRSAWERRGGGRELKTRGSAGPVVIEIAYRELSEEPLNVYHLEIDEVDGRPVVLEERLHRENVSLKFLEYSNGQGWALTGKDPSGDQLEARESSELYSPDTLAVGVWGKLVDYPRVAALRSYITGWHMSCFSPEHARGQPEAGAQEHLSRTGDNLANVIQHLSEEDPEHLQRIFDKLSYLVPKVQGAAVQTMPDGRLSLQFRQDPFNEPVTTSSVSDGTLKLLAYLVLLRDQQPPPLIGIEEPEIFLHPMLLRHLAEECMRTAEDAQVLVATHSPYFIDALLPEDVRVLWLDGNGCTQCYYPARDEKIKCFMEHGALLGDLWTEGHFVAGDPLTNEGMPRPGQKLTGIPDSTLTRA